MGQTTSCGELQCVMTCHLFSLSIFNVQCLEETLTPVSHGRKPLTRRDKQQSDHYSTYSCWYWGDSWKEPTISHLAESHKELQWRKTTSCVTTQRASCTYVKNIYFNQWGCNVFIVIQKSLSWLWQSKAAVSPVLLQKSVSSRFIKYVFMNFEPMFQNTPHLESWIKPILQCTHFYTMRHRHHCMHHFMHSKICNLIHGMGGVFRTYLEFFKNSNWIFIFLDKK